MPQIEELNMGMRKTMVVYFVVDPTLMNAEGMQSTWLWEALERGREGIKVAFEQSEDTEAKLAVLIAGEHPRWLTPEGPVDVNLPCPELTPDVHCRMGEALTELDSKLSRHEFMKSPAGMRAPAILFITGGNSEDDYEQPLESIRENNWFRHALKIAIHVESRESDMAENLVGNKYAVVRIPGCGALADWLGALVSRVNFRRGADGTQSGVPSPDYQPVSREECIIALAEKELEMATWSMIPGKERWNESSVITLLCDFCFEPMPVSEDGSALCPHCGMIHTAQRVQEKMKQKHPQNLIGDYIDFTGLQAQRHGMPVPDLREDAWDRYFAPQELSRSIEEWVEAAYEREPNPFPGKIRISVGKESAVLSLVDEDRDETVGSEEYVYQSLRGEGVETDFVPEEADLTHLAEHLAAVFQCARWGKLCVERKDQTLWISRWGDGVVDSIQFPEW